MVACLFAKSLHESVPQEHCGALDFGGKVLDGHRLGKHELDNNATLRGPVMRVVSQLLNFHQLAVAVDGWLRGRGFLQQQLLPCQGVRYLSGALLQRWFRLVLVCARAV